MFTLENFNGAGQYVVRTAKDYLVDTGFLSSVMFKVGYHLGKGFENWPTTEHVYCLVSVSDGLVLTGYYDADKNYHQFNGLYSLVDYLNNNHRNETYRLATHEELLRVANYQKSRTA